MHQILWSKHERVVNESTLKSRNSVSLIVRIDNHTFYLNKYTYRWPFNRVFKGDDVFLFFLRLPHFNFLSFANTRIK